MSLRTPSTPNTKKSELSSHKPEPLRDPFKDLRWRKDLVDAKVLDADDDEETSSVDELKTNRSTPPGLKPLSDLFKVLRWRANIQPSENDELVHFKGVQTEVVPSPEPASALSKRSRPLKPLKARATIPLFDGNRTDEENLLFIRPRSTSQVISPPTPPPSPDNSLLFQHCHREQAEKLDQLMRRLYVFDESLSRREVSSRI